MKKVFILALCAVLLLATILGATAAYAANTYSEAEILDAIANSWITTCNKNICGCYQGLMLYALGQMAPECETQIKLAVKELNKGFADGYIETQYIKVNLDVDQFCEALDSDSIKSDIETYMNTSAAEILTEEWEAHLKALANINDIVKNGEIADGVDVIDIIKENYAFFIGLESCVEARGIFQAALDADDLSTKRALMLSGASLATFGCEMSIEKADDVLKGKDLEKKPEDIMVDIAEASIDVVSDIVPEIGIFYDTLTITADVGIKMLSMQNKIDALSGYLQNPDTIEEDKCAYYEALSNQYGKFTYSINDFEITMEEYKGYLDVGKAYSVVKVPEALEDFPGFPVVAFDGTFADNLPITEITIPSTIESRSLSSVVNDCDKLKKVTYNALACKGWYLGYFFNNCDSEFEIEFGEGIEVIPERFIGNCGISSITFPEGVRTIYAGALVNCPNLKTLTFPGTVETFEIPFGEHAIVDSCASLAEVNYNPVSANAGYYNAVFADCGNDAEEMQMAIGENVKIIPSNFMIRCGIKSLVFPEGVTQIREEAVAGCEKLETITIPSTVTCFSDNIACDYVFSQCNNLKTVNYNARNAVGETGVFVFENIKSDFQICFGPQIESIPENFISGCDLTAIVFPMGVKSIHYNCLVNCDFLKTVTVPSTVKKIEYNFISDCDKIETVYFDANCANTPSSAIISDSGGFANAAMTVQLGVNVTTVPTHFVENCAISEFVYPEGVRTINEYSLVKCSKLETVVIPSTVEELSYETVGDCSRLKTVVYNAVSAEKPYGGYAFYNCGDIDGMEIRFAENVESLPDHLMYKCTIRSLTFPAGITKIPERAFYGCDALHSLTIPWNIMDIGDEAFYGSTGLTEIRFNAVAMNDLGYNNGVFSDAGENSSGITVIIDDNVPNIPDNLFCPYYSFHDDPKITAVRFEAESTCAVIGEYAFGYCASLTSVEIPSSVEAIEEGAFNRCTGLTSVSIASSVKEIGQFAFYGCKCLPEVVIPNSVTTMGKEVFSDCTGLKTVTMGSGITEIPASAFSGCTALTDVFIGRCVTEIAGQAFSDCTALTSIAIPDSVCVIDYYAFSGCTGLTSITIQDSVTEIGNNAFAQCSSLTSVIYCGTEKQWNAIKIKRGNDAFTDAYRQYHNYRDCVCTICGDIKCISHTWDNGVCSVCNQNLRKAIDLNGDGRVTAFDAQVLAEALAGLRELTDEQWDALGNMAPGDIIEHILGKHQSAE